MKAWGLISLIVMVCAGCSTPGVVVPTGAPVEPYVGPVLSAPVDYDRADTGGAIQALPEAAPVSAS